MIYSFVDRIKELERKAEKYDNTIANFKLFAEELIKIRDAANKLLANFNTDVKITFQQRSGIEWDVICNEWYEKIQAGMEMRSDLVDKAYPEWKKWQKSMLKIKISKKPGVLSRRDGRSFVYYMQKPFK